MLYLLYIVASQLELKKMQNNNIYGQTTKEVMKFLKQTAYLFIDHVIEINYFSYN